MNYQNIYNNLIIKFKSLDKNTILTIDNTIEEHHILPKSCGGNNTPENLVFLPIRQHMFAHLLLYKIYKQNGQKNFQLKMEYACRIMSNTTGILFNSRLMAKIRNSVRKKQIGLICITNGIETKQIQKNEPIPEGWHKGRYLNGKTQYINNGVTIRRILKTEPIPEGWHKGIGKNRIRYITNGIETKHISINDPIPNGWKIGTNSKGMKGKIWITDGKTNKYHDKTKPIPYGWRAGVAEGTSFRSRKGLFYISNGKERKLIPCGSIIPDGWHTDERYFSMCKGTMYIHKGQEEKRIPKTLPIPDGWIKGRVPNVKRKSGWHKKKIKV